jgi:hypothetical protein
MDRSQLVELIQADLDGALSAAERADLARLLLRDHEARRLHEEFRQLDQLLHDIPRADPPPALRAAILSGSAGQAGRDADRAQSRLPVYRLAAAILGGLLIVGLGYLVLDAGVPGSELQGSLGRASDPESSGRLARRDNLSLQAEGVELDATLRRNGAGLRLELAVSTRIPCEVVAMVDTAKMTFVGSPGDAQPSTASGQVAVRLASGSEVFVLDFAGVAPIQLQLRAGGRVVGEGSLSVGD